MANGENGRIIKRDTPQWRVIVDAITYVNDADSKEQLEKINKEFKKRLSGSGGKDGSDN